MSYAVRCWKADGYSYTLGGLVDLAEANAEAKGARDNVPGVIEVVILEEGQKDTLVAWWYVAWKKGRVTQ